MLGNPGRGNSTQLLPYSTINHSSTTARPAVGPDRRGEISPQSSYLAFSASGCGVAFGRGKLYFAGALALPQPHWHPAAVTAAACRGVF